MKDIEIAVIGLGYVGLPLAVEFGKIYPTLGIDINTERIADLKNGYDQTLEVSESDLKKSAKLKFSDSLNNSVLDRSKKTIYIITVPTPIDSYKIPDLTPLRKASESVGKVLKKNDIVVYESTVFPGCTEEECVPILEKFSNLIFNTDFYCGYSPERINPGDKVNTLTKILKVTSGSTPEIADLIDNLYKSIITAGTFKAPSIKVAEAAKLIENCQRDVNISFVNELSLVFDKLNIDTNEVLEAASTKWNFLKFKPGLVGGHCIGVDPYYMIYKAEQMGYYPEVIGAGRRINDNMGLFVANKIIKQMIKANLPIRDSKVLILGFTFKENCPDIRNTKIIDIYNELSEFGIQVDVYDHWAIKKEVEEEYNLKLLEDVKEKYTVVLIAVSHEKFIAESRFLSLYEDASLIFDLKATLPKSNKTIRL